MATKLTKKSKRGQEGALQGKEQQKIYDLIAEANDACEGNDGIFAPLIGKMLDDLKNKHSNIKNGNSFATHFHFIIFLVRASVEITEKRMSQPMNIWTVNLAFPSCKKTPLHKLFNKNLDKFKSIYQRDFIPKILSDAMQGGGTAEALKKSLSDSALTDGCCLIFSNEFNSFLVDLDRYSNSSGDTSFYCGMFDGLSMRRHAKTDGAMNVDKTNMVISGMMQLDFFMPLLLNGSDPSGLFGAY